MTRTSASVESADTELMGPRVGAYAAAATADDDDTTSSDTTSSASIESALAAEEPIESRLCAPHNRYRDGAPPPGIFWLFAIGELVGDKHCAIRTSIFALQW